MESSSMEVQLGEQAMDCCFHPEANLVAAGLIDGRLCISDCSKAEPSRLISLKAHKDSCRAVAFAREGETLMSGSVDCSILLYDLTTRKKLARLKDAHESAVNRVLPMDQYEFASGDDDGCIKTWDRRQKAATRTFSSHTDFISDLALHSSEDCLLATSGDGTLSVNDLRKNKLRARSEDDADDELEAVVVLKHGRKVVCSAQSGVLNIFSWGKFEDCSDRCPGHPTSVDAMLKLDEDTVVTGGGDGVIRVLSIQPHRLLGVLGQHKDGGCDRLALSADRRLLASTTYGTMLYLWDTACLDEEEQDADEEGKDADEEEEKTIQVAEDQQEDGSSDEDLQQKKRQSKAKQRGRTPKKMKSCDASSSAAFFSDLL